MAALLENSSNMFDVALKPRMLRTILKEDVPDDNSNTKPLSNASKLSRIVSKIQTFNLLSESTSMSDAKLMERWKSTVDDWINRLLSLVSNASSSMVLF